MCHEQNIFTPPGPCRQAPFVFHGEDYGSQAGELPKYDGVPTRGWGLPSVPAQPYLEPGYQQHGGERQSQRRAQGKSCFMQIIWHLPSSRGSCKLRPGLRARWHRSCRLLQPAAHAGFFLSTVRDANLTVLTFNMRARSACGVAERCLFRAQSCRAGRQAGLAPEKSVTNVPSTEDMLQGSTYKTAEGFAFTVAQCAELHLTSGRHQPRLPCSFCCGML